MYHCINLSWQHFILVTEHSLFKVVTFRAKYFMGKTFNLTEIHYYHYQSRADNMPLNKHSNKQTVTN